MALERMDPDHSHWYERGVVREHIARYAFAKNIIVDTSYVLDAACGTGYGTQLLAERARSVVGVDISPDAVMAAAKRSGQIGKFVRGNASNLPFKSSCFDAICSFETIEHLPEHHVPIALAEFARVLRPNGKLIISTPDRRSYSLGGATGNVFHPVEFTAEEFEALLKPHFDIENVYGQKFSRKTSLTLARFASFIAGHAFISKLWRAYKMVICRDENVIDVAGRSCQVPMVLVYVARCRAAAK